MENIPLRLESGEERRPEVILPGRPILAPSAPPRPAEKPDYVAALRSRFWVLIIGAFLGGVAGFINLILKVPTYQATVSLEIVGLYDNFMGTKNLAPGNGSPGIDLQEQFGIITSSTLLNHAAGRIRVETAPVNPPSTSFASRLRLRLGSIPSDPAKFTAQAIAMGVATATPKPMGSAHMFAISCSSTSADIAAAAANSIAAEYIAQNQQFHSSTARKSAEWYAQQVGEAKKQMDAAAADLQEYMKSQGAKFALDQNTLDDTKLRQLQMDLSALQADRIEKQSRYNLAKSSPPDSLPEILDDQLLRGLKGHIIEMQQERASLLATLMPEHYKVRRLDAEITATQEAIQNQKANIVKRLQNEYEASLQRERMMSGAYSGESQVVANQTGGVVRYNTLKQAAASTRDYYNQLLAEYNAAQVLAAVPVDNIRVIDPAWPVNVPVSPKPSKAIAGGMFLGLSLGALIVAGLEYILFRRLSLVCSAPGFALMLIDRPELGVVPKLGDVRPLRPVVSRLLIEDAKVESWGPTPLIQESFRLVLASILAQNPDLRKTAIMVTSATVGEGKTTVAAHLGMAMAETGRKVLLIDGDLRRPRLHQVFGLKAEKGLAEMLQSEDPITEQSIAEHVTPSPLPGVSLMLNGAPAPDTAGRIFFSDRVAILFAQLRKMFDILVIDTPPALSFSDARRVGLLTDGTILVVRAEKTSRESAQATASRLAADGIHVFGTVLNDFTPRDGHLYSKIYRTYQGHPVDELVNTGT